MDEIAREPGEYRKVQALSETEQEECAPSAPAAHSAVYFENEPDPVNDTGPEHDAGSPAVQEPAPGAALTRRGDQQRRERDGRKPHQIGAWEDDDQQRGGGQSQQPVQSETCSLTLSAM